MNPNNLSATTVQELAEYSAQNGVVIQIVPNWVRAQAEDHHLVVVSAEDFLRIGSPSLPLLPAEMLALHSGE